MFLGKRNIACTLCFMRRTRVLVLSPALPLSPVTLVPIHAAAVMASLIILCTLHITVNTYMCVRVWVLVNVSGAGYFQSPNARILAERENIHIIIIIIIIVLWIERRCADLGYRTYSDGDKSHRRRSFVLRAENQILTYPNSITSARRPENHFDFENSIYNNAQKLHIGSLQSTLVTFRFPRVDALFKFLLLHVPRLQVPPSFFQAQINSVR